MNPLAGPVQRFAHELRKLRQESGGLTYRRMAARVEFSAPALSQAAAGDRLPSLAVALAFVTACGGDCDAWERRWQEAAHEVDSATADDDTVSPYQGLVRFEPEHQAVFFGRERMISDLLHLVRQRRFVALVGASGSGKSSLLRAGLVARLRTGEHDGKPPAAIRVFTPGRKPWHDWAGALTPADGERDTVVFIDQFEELFTLCQDAEERSTFLELLLSARAPENRLRIVVAIRADFYGRCAEQPELAKAMSEAHLLAGPMEADDLRAAIVKPAASAKLTVERALTAELIDEVAGEPGGLPLLSHALLETWRRRRGRMLTVEGYRAAGGVRGALATTAETLYEQLTPAQARRARQVLLRLVNPDTTAGDTARPVERQEFGDAHDTDFVLEQLARARLITVDEERVYLAHEALITAWPRLHDWIEHDRERLRFHRDLTLATEAWEALDRDPGALYRGIRLAQARDWLSDDTGDDEIGELNASERAFVTAGVRAADAEHATLARNYRRLRHLAIGLAAAVFVAAGLGGLALVQTRQALDEQRQSLSRQLAAQALGLANAQPSTAMLLSVEAYRTAPTSEARGALLTMSTHEAYRGELSGHANAVSDVAFSPDGTTLATVSKDQTVVLWNTRQRTRRATPNTGNPWPRAVAFSPDGRLLATAGDDRTIVLWNPDTAAEVGRVTGDQQRIKDLAFSPDGHTLAAAGDDGTVTLWDLDHRTTITRLVGGDGSVHTVAFSPDGRTVATGAADGSIALWDRAGGNRSATLTGHTASVDDISFSPDGRTLASASPDQTVRLWDTNANTETTILRGHTDQVRTVSFSPDGQTLASAGHDHTVILWDMRRRVPRGRLTGHTDAIYSVNFSPDGHTLASAGEEGRTVLWDVRYAPPASHTDAVKALAFSPDGTALAAAGSDGTVTLTDPRRRTELAAITTNSPANTVAFSPDGHTVAIGTGNAHQATGTADQSLSLWDVTDPSRPAHLADLPGHTDQIRSVAFSPDGALLASTSTDKTAIIWDLRHRVALAVLPHTEGPNSVAFSPDSHTVVTLTGHNHTATLWDVATRTPTVITVPNGLPRGMSFRADGQILAIADTDHTVTLWNTRQHTEVGVLTASDTMTTVAYSPGGGMLATGAVEHTVGLWAPSTGTRVATLSGHTAAVNAVAFSPDGQTLASADADGTIEIWDTDPEATITAICSDVSRNLTTDEWNQYLLDTDYRQTCGSQPST